MLLRCLAFAALSCSAYAQIDPDARRLLQEVETAARNPRNWRAEGSRTSDEDLGRGFRHHSQTQFTYELGEGLHARLHTEEDGVVDIVVCDGPTTWIHHGRAKVYTKTPAMYSGGACAQQLLPWQMLTSRLVSARLAGTGDGCQIVQAEYENGTRTLCIDPVAKYVKTERLERRAPPLRTTITTTVTNFERDPQFAPDTFTFQPPPNTTLSDNSELGTMGVARVGNGVTPPQVLIRHEPEYTQEARKIKYNATVALWLVVGADGVPHDIKVIRAVGMGLDEKAVEAVSTWRFRPGTKDGQPVAVQANIEINFRIL
jgi:TonB family protein